MGPQARPLIAVVAEIPDCRQQRGKRRPRPTLSTLLRDKKFIQLPGNVDDYTVRTV
jgi:hypothetical protein